MSLAAAKLARQHARIQQAEAALVIPLVGKRGEFERGAALQAAGNGGLAAISGGHERKVSRRAHKNSAPLDYTADSRDPDQSTTSEPPGHEVRINTFRARTRDTSLSRSMSSLSQRTTGTHNSDNDFVDASGFQVFSSRRGKKAPELLNAYEGNPEQKQITVEAPVDTREIYEVFGNALPGPDYLQEDPGAKNGQLQFVQHPNGDVSAHQWSTDRFLWENIGQFSNIRKRVEGQLAADRLKGETAQQTLQQNTLVYFRTVAKQREATVMGLPFGMKDIQIVLPKPVVKEAATEMDPKTDQIIEDIAPPSNHEAESIAKEYVDPRPLHQPHPNQAQHYTHQAYPNYETSDYGPYSQAMYGSYGYGYSYNPSYPQWAQLSMQHNGCINPRHNNSLFAGRGPTQTYDQFYPQQSLRQIYGNPMPVTTSPAVAAHSTSPTRGLNYDFHFPPVDPRLPAAQGSLDRGVSGMAGHGAHSQHITSSAPVPPATTLREDHEATNSRNQQDVAPPALFWNSDNVVLSKPERSRSRTKMREHLAKLSDHAKERSISQNNIRTVMYDPFRTQSADVARQAAGITQQNSVPVLELKKTVANPSGLPPRLFQSTSEASAYQASQHAGVLPSVSASTRRSPIDTSSSPESCRTIQEAGISHDPSSVSQDYQNSRPRFQRYTGNSIEELIAYFEAKHQEKLAADLLPSRSQHRPGRVSNSSTFARHEDLFNAIKATEQAIAFSSVNDLPATLAPIGTPARKDSAVGNSSQDKIDAHTRMLIPIWENLASYVSGPPERRRDYFSQWTKAPEHAIDHNDNTTFFDKTWVEPSASLEPNAGRRKTVSEATPPRYVDVERQGVESVRFGGFSSPTAKVGDSLGVGAGLQGRFAFGRL
ncbi:hypothetical protein LTR62_002213 [Meristemomyces frigidus]|uniref:Uncharacterized protein n=1 Tax=Meristemomyces frigidus TaxID=1508187 RepID=A0AAN7TJN9_9PEZI|nr:hypothetical protein LTR62_002213 [Meristemomyces frigidus]